MNLSTIRANVHERMDLFVIEGVKNNRRMKSPRTELLPIVVSTGAPCTHGASPRVPTTGATKDIGLTAIIRLVALMLHCAPNEHCSQI